MIWIHIEWAALLKTMWLSYDFKVKTRNPSHILWFFTVNEWTAHSLITVDNCLQVIALYTLAIGAVLLFLNISICEKIRPKVHQKWIHIWKSIQINIIHVHVYWIHCNQVHYLSLCQIQDIFSLHTYFNSLIYALINVMKLERFQLHNKICLL